MLPAPLERIRFKARFVDKEILIARFIQDDLALPDLVNALLNQLHGIGRNISLDGNPPGHILTAVQRLFRNDLSTNWGQHLWARGYWVVTSGNVTDDVWKEYIETQKPPEPDDNFQVV